MKDSNFVAPSIAVVGMAGRFPGARNLTEFWRNLRGGVESISFLSDSQLLAAGATPADLDNPDYVRASAILDDVDRFDAAFFGLSPRDASIMDPQHRHFLECAWEALEHAGWSPDEFPGRVGVYAGSGLNSYLIHNLLANDELVASAGLFLLKQTGNDKDVLASRVSYQLNLTGPSLAVQTACSTSLVAIHLACQGLLTQECDMALAGGVTIEIPHGLGYLYREGEILSRDGHCRSFDADSSGTVFGSGLGIVVLRRLEDAIRDGDFIHAVILGTAINNDGARKVGYLAPSVAGQSDAIVEALDVAGARADSISYVETHGTGTVVGDPIEISALTRAFRSTTDRNRFCAIGSLKTNVGHLDAAAGVAGFIKTVLALENRQLPPSINFSRPNPSIDFDRSPFYVNTELRDWASDGSPRRAGVTALGIGGTNAHAILEEAPPATESDPSRAWQVLTLSAKTPAALDSISSRMSEELEENAASIADVAFTTHVGRKALRYRRAIVCKDSADAIEMLRRGDRTNAISNSTRESERPVIFLCTGQGAQYVSMGRGLYESEPDFKSTIDYCADYLTPLIGFDLRTILYPSADNTKAAAEMLNQTRFTQPALFVLEYAMAKLWSSWGIEPAALIGHSIGEFAAACIAGVFSLEAGLQIVAERGRLIQTMPGGSMIAVPMTEREVIPLLNGKLSLASVNADEQCVVSGPDQAIGALETSLAGKGMEFHRLRVSHAFHSSMMDPVVREFAEFMRQFELAPPRIPYISSATGTWISGERATDPDYWAGQLRNTVRFADGIAQTLTNPDAILLEVGPGHTLSALCEQSPKFSSTQEVICSLRAHGDDTSDQEFVARAVGRMWAAGKRIDWKSFHAQERRRRLPLPTYPFERERFWIEPGRKKESAATTSDKSAKDAREVALFSPSWKRVELAEKKRPQNAGPWLIFEDMQGLAPRVTQLLRRRGQQCVTVHPGLRFAQIASDRYEINPDDAADYQKLLAEVAKDGKFPRTIVHAWSVWDVAADQNSLEDLPSAETTSFYSLLYIGQALAASDLEGPIEIAALSNSLHRVADEPIAHPARALLAGPCGVIPKEIANVTCRIIDVELSELDAADKVAAELQADVVDSPVVYRKSQRWIRSFDKVRGLEKQAPVSLRDQGVYVITGGLGGIGLVLARSIADSVRARLVLVSRSAFPRVGSWDEWLETHGEGDPISEEIRKIRAIEDAGSQVLVATGDVCDAKAMQRIATQVRGRFGVINGVIHAAGVLEDAPLLQKDRKSAARVLAPKVRGTLVLESVYQHDPLDFFVVMSSVSSHLAPAGQVDYTAANAFLDTFAASKSLNNARFVSIQWPRWTDVGMAATEMRGSSNTDRVHPLLGAAERNHEDRTTYSSTLSVENDWIVDEHRLRGRFGLFPATGYLEIARAAIADIDGSAALSITDFYVNQPLRVKPRAPQPIQFVVRRLDDGYRFSLRTRADGSYRWVECASGTMSAVAPPAMLPHYDVESIRRRCNVRTLDTDRATRNESQERHIEFGPRWHNLKAIWLGRNEALASVELPAEFAAEVETYRLHPALLDMATGSAIFLIAGNDAGYLYVPVSYGSVSIAGPLPAACYSYIRSKTGAATEGAVATFDISILDRDGNAVVEIRDFSVRQIRDVAMLQENEQGEKSHAAETSNGITSEEGAKAFEVIIANPRLSSVVVFPSDFAASVEMLKPNQIVPTHEAPPPSPPSDSNEDVEMTLTRWWKELLGVETVGTRDNFFDLGGQSLTGARLIAKVNKKYGVDLKLAMLFSAPTIDAMCGLLRNKTAPKVFNSLIPIQPSGTKPPLFLIHEIEGSVLVFRDLVKHLDPDQPVWGVEYAGSDSTSEPLLRMEDLAARYLDEVRKLQPHGPYYLLGYSFGGMLGFEMAQQLHAVGERVELLGMLDTFLMNGVHETALQRSMPQRLLKKAGSFGRHVRRIVFGPERRAYLNEDVAERIDAIIGHGRQYIYGMLSSRGRAIPKFLLRAKDVNWYAAYRYKAVPYPGRVTLFRANTPLNFAEIPPDKDLGWGPLAEAGVDVHEIPGTHREIMREPNVSIVARELAAALAAARSRQLNGARPKTVAHTLRPLESPRRSAETAAVPNAT